MTPDSKAPRAAVVSIRLPWPPAALNPNARKKWERIAATTEYRMIAWGLAHAKHRRTPVPPPVHAAVLFVVRDKRRRDLDNCLSMLKPAWDGFVDAGLLQDDRAGMLEISMRLEMRREEPEPYVQIELTEAKR